MSNKILIKRTGTPGKVPGTADVAAGELALNVVDAKVYVGTGTAVKRFLLDDDALLFQPQSTTLNSLNSVGSGILAKIGSGIAAVTMTGSASVSVTNGDAQSGAPAFDLTDTGVAAGSYGSASAVPIVSVDQKGRVSTVSSANITPTAIGAVSLTQLGVANGAASLDATGKIPQSQLPSVAIVNTFVVASEAAMLALTAQTGDIAVRTDLSESFILTTNDPTQVVNWQQLLSPTAGVTSVNGMTGAVTVTDITGNSGTATKLQTSRNITLTGDVSGSTSFDGSANAGLTTALAATGVAAGTYNNSATALTPFTVDTKGRVTSVGVPVTVTPAWSSITNTPTTLAGYGITDAPSTTAGSGTVLQSAHGDIVSMSGTTQIPLGTAAPLITQGTQIWSVGITPKNATSHIGISFTITADASANNRTLIVAVFRGSTCIATILNEIDTSSHPKNMTLLYLDLPNTTSPIVYSARIGVDSTATWYCNSTVVGNTMGGTLNSNVRVDEIA